MRIAILGVAHPHIFGMVKDARTAPGVEIVGVWDADPQLRATAAEKLQAPAIDSLERALALKPEVAMTTAVPSTRADIAIRSMQAGVPIVVDKPMAVTQAALDKVIAAQKKTGVAAITYYVVRGDALYVKAKQILDSGAIGKLVRVASYGPHKLNPATRPAWHFSGPDNGGALIDIGSHHIDLSCWLHNATPTWLVATHANFTQPQHAGFQDFAQATMRFPSGGFAHIEVDWLNPVSMKSFGDTRLLIQGTTGKIEIRLGDHNVGHLWTDKVAAEPIDVAGEPGGTEWTVKLLQDLAARWPTDISQEETWRASRVTLQAFESAAKGGVPITLG
jgi:predicted dehydrogenase